jgi:hypothetical protein
MWAIGVDWPQRKMQAGCPLAAEAAAELSSTAIDPCPAQYSRERIFIELMTSSRNLEVSREGSK